MRIERCDKEEVFEYVDLQKNDVILYLGGRIDDDNLYPPKYRKYLKAKIKRLKPTKIICHNHWYAKKYYEKGILTKNTKIDMAFVCYHYVAHGRIQGINPTDYNDHRTSMKILIDKNPNIVYAMYISEGYKPATVDVKNDWFREDYDLNNVKYFSFGREYSLSDFDDGGWHTPPPAAAAAINLGLTPLKRRLLGYEPRRRNASDGFGMLTNLMEAGFKNINILGFSAFGSDEDMSYHTEFGPENPRFAGRKYFDLGTSEDQSAEADILEYLVQTKKIKNVEDYDKFISCLKDEEDNHVKY